MHGLAATVGAGAEDQPCIVTAGDDLRQLAHFVSNGEGSYSAEDVITSILAQNCAMDVVRAFVSKRNVRTFSGMHRKVVCPAETRPSLAYDCRAV